jgi:hypothetical protein
VESRGEGVRGERREPVLVALVVAISLGFFMPDGLTPGPRWLLPAVEGAFVVVFAVMDPGRIDRRSRAVRVVRMALEGLLAFGASWAGIRLVVDLIEGGPDTNSASDLLTAGGLVWTKLIIVFGLLFWELDSGGPGERAHESASFPDFAFPQHLSPEVAPPGWRPVFLDYLYLGFTNALAFSPTDAMPLTHRAKATMAVESAVSLLILGLVIARAVNVIA